jgi:antitoxin component YwqK of YwqJK toxin-antitoxin module
LDSYGQFDGSAVYYYEDGTVNSEGRFKGGFRLGEWKNYNEKGDLVSRDIYNSNGQVEKSVKE